MRQITVRLPEDRYELLETVAEKRGVPVAVMARSLIMQTLAEGEQRQREREGLRRAEEALRNS